MTADQGGQKNRNVKTIAVPYHNVCLIVLGKFYLVVTILFCYSYPNISKKMLISSNMESESMLILEEPQHINFACCV